MIEAVVRDHLNISARRSMVVTQPIKVTVVGEGGKSRRMKIPDFPNEPERGEHEVIFESPFYIEADDWRDVAEKGYRRLCPGQTVGLRYAGLVMEFVEAVRENGKVVELKVKVVPVDSVAKPKAFIHWVADPVPVEVRIYNRLFKHKNPEDTNEVPGGFLTDIAENTLDERKGLADRHIQGSEIYSRYQFERIGFFSVDTDSKTSENKLVFNLTVGLKEDAGK